MTWRELNWAWEAKKEQELDTLALLRYELQKVETATFAVHGVRVPFPKWEELSPLKGG